MKEDLNLLGLPPLNLEEERRKKKEESEDEKTRTSCFFLPTSFYVVDMRKERWKVRGQAVNYSCISKKLKSEITYALKNKLQTILLINRQGMSSFSVCTNCKTVLNCPKCERALVYDKAGYYVCVHCAYKSSITPHCSHCQGINFQNIGLGTQKVEREINNLFPGARVARLDSQSARSGNFQESVYRDFSRHKIDILIGTQMISKGWDLPSVSLVGIIDTDNMLSVPDFSTSEKAFQNIVQVSGRVARPGSRYPGVVIIQTYHPENDIIKFASERNYGAFLEKELSDRRSFDYPPFGRLVKLVFQNYKKENVSQETAKIYQILEPLKNIKVTEAQDSFVPNIRGRHRMQIIIKIPDEIPLELKNELKKLGQGWIIDVDPVSVT
jgi:primosomal protein N' (replication factor Y)